MAKLRITMGGETTEQEITKPVWSAGRSPDLDLTLPVRAASRSHFKIGQLPNGGWAIQDSSTNGTVVNDQLLKGAQAKLAHNDTIRIGDCTVVFLDPPAPQPTKKRPPAPAPVKKKKRTIAPAPEKKGPIVLKSKAQKLQEQKDAERQQRADQRKKARAKAEAEEAAAEGVAAEEVADEKLKGAIDIDSEETLDKVLKDRAAFDAALASGERSFTFGNYQLTKRLQEGGMGVVFKARHLKEGFDVALKVLRTEMIDEQNIARFKQEAWAISAFDHKNIVKVRDLARHGGMYFIAMEFIKGEDLLKVGFKHTLTFWQIMEAVDKMADVLRLVHARNIWHRDIKPQNILLETKTGEVKLIDFGIATVEREKDDATQTAEGLIMGTPAFLSPEQAARGKMGEIDGRADLYSLGCVMYYLLTGRRPFTGRSALEILRKNMTEDPPAPQSIEEMAPDGLCKVCLKMMQKHPDDRYSSAVELRAAFEQWRKTKEGRHELERHKKIMELRAKKKKAARP